MPGRSYRNDRDEDGWIRPYDPSRDVGDWSTRPPANRDHGRHNYGFDRDDDEFYRDPYYNRPYYISGQERRTAPKYSSNYPVRHIPISTESRRRNCIYYALTVFSVIALLLLAALVVFLVLFLLEQQNNPAIPPTTQSPTVQPPRPPSSTQSIQPTVRVYINATLIQPFLPAYNNAMSPEYKELENNFINSMDVVFASSNLANSYIGTNVNDFKPGSVIVDTTLTFNENVVQQTGNPMGGQSTESMIGEVVVNTIVAGIESGSCCQNVAIDSNSVMSTRVVIEGVTTSAPTPQPSTTQPPIPASTQQPVPPDTQPPVPPDTQPPVPPDTQPPVPPDTQPPVPPDTQPPVPPDTQPPVPPDTQPPVPPGTQPPVPPGTQPPVPPGTQPPVPPTTQPPIDSLSTPVPDPIITTQGMVDQATTSPPPPVITTATVASSMPTANPNIATTEPPAQLTTVVTTTTSTPTGTEGTVPVTTDVGMTTGIVPMSTTVEETTNSVTTEFRTTSLSETSLEMTTVEAATTPQPSVLNQPGCGLATNPPPSPTNASLTVSGTWPWAGSLRFRQGHACGVALLSQQWAVTSASCIPSGGALVSLVFGDITSSYSQSIAHIERNIQRIYQHPGFTLATYDNDIAFIKMTRPVEFSNNIGSVCLQQDEPGGAGVSSYSNCYVAGWSTLTMSVEDNLKTASVSSISEGPCSAGVVDLRDKFICAQFPNADAYVADFASGLMCQKTSTGVWSLVGILDSAATDWTTATFTKVSFYWDAASSIIDGVSTIPCESVQVPQCMSALPYSSTYPTMQASILNFINTAESIANLCHTLVNSALCTILLPNCRANGNQLTLCRQTCQEISSLCPDLFNQLSLTVDCEAYPFGQPNSQGLCQAGIDESCGNYSLSLPTLFDPTIISSPNYPLNYAVYEDCVWLITGPQDSHIVVKFLFLETESCCDTITIGTGQDVEDWTSIQERIFGSTLLLPVVVPSANTWLRFQSDFSGQHRGFQAEIRAVGSTGLASFCSEPSTYSCSDGQNCIPFQWRCDGINDCIIRDDESCRVVNEEITLGIDDSQRITSPGFGTTGYVNFASHTYVVTTTPGRKLRIDFHDFETEIDFDFFTVGDGNNPDDESMLFFRWDGGLLPPSLLSNGDQVWIQFISDGLITGRGFDLTVYDVDSSESISCDASQFDCGHSVCLPENWQCDTESDCVDGSDEARCVPVPLSAFGSMVLSHPFIPELENKTSPEFTDLNQQFTTAMDSVLSTDLGSQYILPSTTVNRFSSTDNPVLRAGNISNTVVAFTIFLLNQPPTSALNETRQVIMDVLLNEVNDSKLVNLAIDPTSVQIYEVFDLRETTPVPPTDPPLCSSGEFECDGGRCIPRNYVCNQKEDCNDGTDEAFGPLCPISCGASVINISSSTPVRLKVPMILPEITLLTFYQCQYTIIAPANQSVLMTVHNVSLHEIVEVQIVEVVIGAGHSFVYKTSIVPSLDIMSFGNTLRINVLGYWISTDHFLDAEFRVTSDSDIETCTNQYEILPSNKICDQTYDCMDHTDEINCFSECGQANLTVHYNASTILQLTNYPSNYKDNMACQWLITGPLNAFIIFQTDVIDIVQLDSLSFGQGHDPYDPSTTVAVVPGILPTGSSILVSGGQAWVRFLTNSLATATGFSVSIRVLDDKDFIRCDNLVQVVYQEQLCDGIAQCQGQPTDEANCDACFSIPIANCSKLLPYSTTEYPNQFALDATVAIAQYQRAQNHFCHPQTELVICSLLFRECPANKPNSRAVCRSTCQAAVAGCNFNAGVCDSLPRTGNGLWCYYDNDFLETGICGTRPQAPNPFSRIVNGQDASLGEWPFAVAVLDANYVVRCAATLINRQWAVTAAHCTSIAEWLLMGFIDKTNLGDHYQLQKIAQIVRHPFYDELDSYNQEHDIALLKFDTPLNFTDYIRPACLNTKENETEIFDKCYAAGWGRLSEAGLTPDVLQDVQLHLVTHENCSQAHQGRFLINENMLCAGYEEGGRDTCQGDSGGPLVCEEADGRWTLTGVTSFGQGCARPSSPGVYVRISQYLEFIEFYIREDQTTQLRT